VTRDELLLLLLWVAVFQLLIFLSGRKGWHTALSPVELYFTCSAPLDTDRCSCGGDFDNG